MDHLTEILIQLFAILVAAKVEGTTKARTTLGMPRTLSSRLQPNHPTDDLRGVAASTLVRPTAGAGSGPMLCTRSKRS